MIAVPHTPATATAAATVKYLSGNNNLSCLEMGCGEARLLHTAEF
jgi:hypothetical protein